MRTLIQSYADEQAKLRPAATAVVSGNEHLTYDALGQWSNSLARALQSSGCRRGDRVALAVSKSPFAIAGILGILKADCIYVPLDVESPTRRAARILENCEPRLLLADASGAKLVRELHTDSMTNENVPRFSSEPIRYENGPDDIAYILYTSGSTGVPKGVPITHSNVAHFVDWAVSHFELTSDERISGHPPLHFDLSVFDIFGAMAAGAELHLVPAIHNLSARNMVEFIRSSELTQWFSVPSALNYMAKFDAVRRGDFPKLKRVLWCGEVLPASTLRYWMERLPGVQFTNLYGPTEATIASSYFTVPSMPAINESIPIGRPCDGESLLVLDDELRPVQPETVGDLYIGGAGLSPGYWKDEEKTCAAFRTMSEFGRIYRTGDCARIGADGLIYFAGRADSQIKSRGYRIELGEIEAALSRIENLKEAAVVAIPTSEFEGALICCAFAPLEGVPVNTIKLRETLGTIVPRYMLPGRWLAMDRLPRNTNGKIDRPCLTELFQTTVQSIEVQRT
jgi:amino acid adenylation domain-containing protein